MERRRFLGLAGAITVGVAGCTGDDDDPDIEITSISTLEFPVEEEVTVDVEVDISEIEGGEQGSMNVFFEVELDEDEFDFEGDPWHEFGSETQEVDTTEDTVVATLAVEFEAEHAGERRAEFAVDLGTEDDLFQTFREETIEIG